MKDETKESYSKQTKKLKSTKLIVKCPHCKDSPKLKLFEYSRKHHDKKFIEFIRWECDSCNIVHPNEFFDENYPAFYEKFIKRKKR